MLGSEVFSRLKKKGNDVLGFNSTTLDINNRETIKRCLKKYKPEFVINCAAFTNVDACEVEQVKSFAINAKGPEYISYMCSLNGCKLIHFSTDYVFDGEKMNYTEDMPTHPLQNYGLHKMFAETQVERGNSVIVRVQWLYGENKKTYITWMIESILAKKNLKVYTGQVGVPTSCSFIADHIDGLMNLDRGIYHFAPNLCCTKYDVAMAINHYLNGDMRLISMTSEIPLNWKAKRPRNVVLKSDKVKKCLNTEFDNWKLVLGKYLEGGSWKKLIQGVS